MSYSSKHEEELYDELFTTERNIIHKIDSLINAEWDSNTLKTQIEDLVKSYWVTNEAINDYDEKQKGKT